MDPEDPRGKFVGANDNASGVAILMQLARDMPELKSKYGVDFLMLDGEEFIFDRSDRFFSAPSISPASMRRRSLVIVGGCCWTWWAAASSASFKIAAA